MFSGSKTSILCNSICYLCTFKTWERRSNSSLIHLRYLKATAIDKYQFLFTAGYLFKIHSSRKHTRKVMHHFCLFCVHMKSFSIKQDKLGIRWHTLQKSAFVNSGSKYNARRQLEILSTAGYDAWYIIGKGSGFTILNVFFGGGIVGLNLFQMRF